MKSEKLAVIGTSAWFPFVGSVSPGVTALQGAYVEGSVLMPGVRIEPGAVVRRAILDKNVVVPAGAHIGVEPELDKQRYHVSEGGITVLGKGALALP